MEKTNKELFEKIVTISQSRGFVFNASSIYGGLRSSYDYGPLGVSLKNKSKNEIFNDLVPPYATYSSCLLYTSPSPRD